MTIDTVSKTCKEHGVHCWHTTQTIHSDSATTFNRICCWCGERWVQRIVYDKNNGWSLNPDGHPEHGRHHPLPIKVIGNAQWEEKSG